LALAYRCDPQVFLDMPQDEVSEIFRLTAAIFADRRQARAEAED
jgi:hypothetical protein